VLGVIFWLSQKLTYVVENKQRSVDIARLLEEKKNQKKRGLGNHRLATHAVGETVNPQVSEDALLSEERERKELGVGKAHMHSFELARRKMIHRVAAGSKETVVCQLPLPRNILDPSFCSRNIKSEYVLDVELLVPYAENPIHSFPDTIFIVQATDVSNTSKPIQFRDVKYAGLSKGALDTPEVYYGLPPDPCSAYHPVPFECPPIVPRYAYTLQPCAVGLPGPLWQRVLAKVDGTETEFSIDHPPGRPWKVGIGQFVCPDVLPPEVEGFTFRAPAVSAAVSRRRNWDEGVLTAAAAAGNADDGEEEEDALSRPLVAQAASTRQQRSRKDSFYSKVDDDDDPMRPFEL
jgi:hypothetical protein